MSVFVQQSEFADPIVLELVERDEPHPGPGEVRVRVYAAGLNPVDWKLASNARIANSMGLTLPTGFGNDLAGVVDEVGKGVTGFVVGDRVYGGARGRAVAEHAIVSPAKLHHTPQGLDDERAGALQSVGLTAEAAVDGARLEAGDTVLIGGAAGGVGVLAVQLAVRGGATVIATSSAGNHEFLRSLGAIATSYGPGLVDRVRGLAPYGVTAAMDLHGTETAEAAHDLGVSPDRIVTIAALVPPTRGAVARGSLDAADGALERIARLIASGEMVLPIAGTFPIDRIDDAIALQRTGHVRGKVVVTIP